MSNLELEKELEELEKNMKERLILAKGKWSLSLDSTWEGWWLRKDEILRELGKFKKNDQQDFEL
jgi:hypothetical protein